MCSVFGALVPRITDLINASEVTSYTQKLMELSKSRGRDGYGYKTFSDGHIGQRESWEYKLAKRSSNPISSAFMGLVDTTRCVTLGNFRAEPTTEYVKDKRPSDQQPYSLGKWVIVHNGTIANDTDLRTGEIDTRIDSAAIAEVLNAQVGTSIEAFEATVKQLIGSYAILAYNTNEPETMYYATNYRPLWYVVNDLGVFFTSSENYFPERGNDVPRMVAPYTMGSFTLTGDKLNHTEQSLLPASNGKKALIIASGGLDSTVAAAWCKDNGYDVHLLHFSYGCKAEGEEARSIQAIADRMDVPVTFFPLSIYDKDDSPLLNNDVEISTGESGAEFAHEWVPARNLVMLSVATSYAEAKGFDYIVLGNNLEEAGAYPDNEPEFIEKFSNLLPFAVGAGKRVEILMPVGNLMKHEIVALGNTVDAPMDLCWSCYKQGDIHCGQCGPCFMRKTAFQINGLTDLNYEK